jgi:hypothetical protein
VSAGFWQDSRQGDDNKNIVDESLEFFTDLVKMTSQKRRTNDVEKTSLKVIELVKNGFVVPARVRTLSASGFPEAFDKLAEKAEKYADSVSEFTGVELTDDKYYRVREASILSFLVLTDAMKSLKIIDRLDSPINELSLREYLYLYNSQLHLLSAELKDALVLAKAVCDGACALPLGALRYVPVPLLIMGLSSEIGVGDKGWILSRIN